MMVERKSKTNNKELKSLTDWAQHYQVDETHVGRFGIPRNYKNINGQELADRAINNVVQKRKKPSSKR